MMHHRSLWTCSEPPEPMAELFALELAWLLVHVKVALKPGTNDFDGVNRARHTVQNGAAKMWSRSSLVNSI